MKQITDYILETHKIESNILKDIDINNWKWNSAYSENSYLNKCKENVKEFAKTLYPDAKPYEKLELLCKETYKDYLSIGTKMSDKELDEYVKKDFKVIDNMGFAQFEYYCLGQGWWVFIDWVIKQKK